MIDESVTQAVSNAMQYLQEIYEAQNVPIDNVLLEELERSPDGTYWLVTLGFNAPIVTPLSPLATSIRGTHKERLYKVLKVRGDTGTVESMKMR